MDEELSRSKIQRTDVAVEHSALRKSLNSWVATSYSFEGSINSLEWSPIATLVTSSYIAMLSYSWQHGGPK